MLRGGQLANRGLGFDLDGVADREQPGRHAVHGDDRDRPARAGRGVDRVCQRRQVDATTLEQPTIADEDHARPGGRIDRSSHAATDDRCEVRDPPEPDLVLVRSGDDRRSERVLARALDGAGEVEQVVGRETGSDDDLGDGRTPEGQRARLVEHDGVHAMGDLERRTAADEDPRLRPASRPDHDGGRGGEAHRARTRDDDDADEGRQRQRDARLRPERQPREERARGDDEDDRDEDLGDAIGQSLDGRLAALGPTHEVHDPGERGIASDPGRPHHERAGRVEGRSDDLGAGGHLDRHGLAGQHAGVDRGAALDDDAVDGHPLPRPDAQQVTDRHRLERHVLFAPVGHAPGGLGPETQEPPDRPGRAGLGAMLEPPTEQDEPDDDRRRVEVGLRVQPGLVDDVGEERHEDAVQPGRARADRHERVHVGGAMPGGPPRCAVEAAPRPDLDDRGRHEREPVDGLHRDAGLRHEHRDHDREGDRDGDDRLAKQRALLARAVGVVRGQLLEQGDRGRAGVGGSVPAPHGRRTRRPPRPRPGRRAPATSGR